MFGPGRDTNANQQFDTNKVLAIASSHNLETAPLAKTLNPNYILLTSNSELESAGIVAARLVQKSVGRELNSGQAMELLSFGIDCLTQVAPSHYQQKEFADKLIILAHVQEAFTQIVAEASSNSKLDKLPDLAKKVQAVSLQLTRS